MRGSLMTNPKVIKMARTLLQDPEFLGWYGNEAVTPDASQAVTRRHVTVVTRVVVGALTPLWAQVNECAGTDFVLPDASLFEVDEMAGVPGFGRAMDAVNWLSVMPDSKGIKFPNFIEHNTVGKERSTGAKTNAQRQAELRARRKSEAAAAAHSNGESNDQSNGESNVTRNHREEKSREEDTSSLRSEVAANAPPPSSRPKKPKTTLGTYLAHCRAEGRKPLPPDHFVRAYCRDAGITDEMLQVAWITFRDQFATGTGKAKQQADWPAHFANAVKGRWAKLWFTNDRGEVEWTATGLQEKRVLDARIAANHVQQEGEHAPA